MWVGWRTWCGSWPAAWGTSLWQGWMQWGNNHSGMLPVILFFYFFCHSNNGGKMEVFFAFYFWKVNIFWDFFSLFAFEPVISKYLKLNTLLFSISWINTDRVTFLYDLLMFNLWAFLYPQVKSIFRTWRLAALPTHID